MKKIKVIILLSCLFLVGGSSYWVYASFIKGEAFYTEVTTDGREYIMSVMDRNEQYKEYEYQLAGYNKEGVGKTITFNSSLGRPLRKGAYLKLKVHEKKGVLGWEEVSANDIPEKAKVQLSH